MGYVARKKDQLLGEVEWNVPAFDSAWRPRVVHCFDGVPGQVRGITPLVPALRVARQFDQLADATLTAAIVQSVFAATITSDEPTEEVLQGLITPQEQAKLAMSGQSTWDAWFEAQSGWYDSATLNVGINGRIAHLFPGQKMEFHSANHPSSDYKDFSLHLLREIARCLGLTYESATGDYEGATYSSVRMATGEVFAITLYRRAFIVAPFCQAAYEAWLEEEIEAGTIQFPGGIEGFRKNRPAACRALWRGTPKPQADDYKAAQAHKVWRDMGVMTDEMIANDLGVDIEDVYVQRAREAEMREGYGLKDEVEREQEMQEAQLEVQREGQKEAPTNGNDD
jgi:lambda family phage portal protein